MRKKKGLHGLNGVKFLAHIAKCEKTCSNKTRREMPKQGEKAPVCYEMIGMVLIYLDSFASCYGGCAGGDHRVEYLIGRATSTAYSAVSLVRSGYYDQSLGMARTLGEIANLVSLFLAENSALEAWKNSAETSRKRDFSPVKVRLRLEALGAIVPVAEDRYSRLSTTSIHSVPNSAPQVHNQMRVGVTYPVYQQSGLLLALNEIAVPLSFLVMFAPRLLNLNDAIRKSGVEMALTLGNAIGGISILDDDKPWLGSREGASK